MVMPAPGNLIYSATKTFASYLGEGLFYEFEGKVDVIAYNPSFVTTKMTIEDPNHGGVGYISPEVAAEMAFRDLGVEPVTFGHHSH
jgi:short-subunit dehydrogenase